MRWLPRGYRQPGDEHQMPPPVHLRAGGAERYRCPRHRDGTVTRYSGGLPGACEASQPAVRRWSSGPGLVVVRLLRYPMTIDDHAAAREWIAEAVAAINPGTAHDRAIRA